VKKKGLMKKKLSSHWKIMRGGQDTRLRPLLFVTAFTAIGVMALVLTRAATPTASIQPEGGTVTAPAAAISDAAASGGQAVKFQASSSGGGGQTCPPFPAFPDANCTGVTSGTSLTVVNSDVSITQAGSTYSAKDVRGRITVNANNVTIKNVYARDGIKNNANNLLIEDTELGPTGASGGDDGLIEDNYTCRRCDIHNFSDGAKINGNLTIEDSYIHDLWGKSGDHNDGVQAFILGGDVLLRHNYISSDTINNLGSENGAIQMADGWLGTATLENNLFDSNGAIVVRLHENGTYYVRNNRWTRKGDRTHYLVYGIIAQWTGNAFQDNGQAIPQ
jgi:hypothetical protein